jgi:conjugal transfer pilus assembly protein TraW
MFLKLSLGFLCVFSSGIAKDFGVAGKLFPIQEEDISKVFSEGLKEPSEEHKQAWRKKIEERVRHPIPVSGLKEAEKYRCLEFDPTLVVDEDILDDRGNVLARKGEKINPCTHQKREGGLLFFDGDIEEHVEWAESQCVYLKISRKMLSEVDALVQKIKKTSPSFSRNKLFYDAVRKKIEKAKP